MDLLPESARRGCPHVREGTRPATARPDRWRAGVTSRQAGRRTRRAALQVELRPRALHRAPQQGVVDGREREAERDEDRGIHDLLFRQACVPHRHDVFFGRGGGIAHDPPWPAGQRALASRQRRGVRRPKEAGREVRIGRRREAPAPSERAVGIAERTCGGTDKHGTLSRRGRRLLAEHRPRSREGVSHLRTPRPDALGVHDVSALDVALTIRSGLHQCGLDPLALDPARSSGERIARSGEAVEERDDDLGESRALGSPTRGGDPQSSGHAAHGCGSARTPGRADDPLRPTRVRRRRPRART